MTSRVLSRSSRTLRSIASAQSVRQLPRPLSASFPVAKPSIPLPTTPRAFSTSASKMGVHNVRNQSEYKDAITKNSVVVLDAFATWCGPCKIIAPQVEKFSEKYTSAHFIKLDVDEVPDVAQELNIRAMPTFVLFKDGEKVADVVGANPVALEGAIAKLV